MRRLIYVIVSIFYFLFLPKNLLAQSSFDGTWSILVVTEQGRCDKSYKYIVKMINGEVKYGGQGKFSINGSISSNGKVSGTIIRNNSRNRSEPNRANFSGVLSTNSGSGNWTGTSNGGCSGYWEANRGATLGILINI